MKNWMQSLLKRFLSPRQNPAAFYYHHEQLQYEESLENSRVRYLTSFDKAA